MEHKLFGLGMANIAALFILFCLMIICMKVVFTKYPVKGVTDAVNTI